MNINKSKIYVRKIFGFLNTNRFTRKFVAIGVLMFSLLLIPVTGLFDKKWYRAQKIELGDTRDKLPSLLHYLLVGRKKGYMPNPLFIPAYIDPGQWRGARVDPLLKYILKKSYRTKSTHPLFSGKNSTLGYSFFGPLASFLSKASDDTLIQSGAEHGFNGKEKITWGDYKKHTSEYLTQWSKQENLKYQNRLTKHFDKKKEQKFIDTVSGLYNFSDEKKPIVTIIMPAWNREDLIGDAIESVQKQTFQNWELFVVDDGSEDATIDIVQSYAVKDTRINLIKAKHGGVCRARNLGIKHATGVYIAFLDSDNTWTEHYLQVMISAMRLNKHNAAYAAVAMNDNSVLRYRVNAYNKALLRVGNYIDLNVLVVKKEYIDKVGYFDEKLRRMVDYDIVLRLSEITDLHYLPFVGVNYSHQNSHKRITNTELVSWNGVVKNRNLINWKFEKDSKNRVGVGVVIVVKEDIFAVLRCLGAILNKTDLNVFKEIIIVDISTQPSIGIIAKTIAEMHPKFKYTRTAEGNDPSIAANIGFTHTTSEKIIFIQESCVVETGWEIELISQLTKDTAAVGPLQLNIRREIHSGGIDFPFYERGNATPVLLLKNHPLSDARRFLGAYEVPASLDGCIAINAQNFCTIEGFNPLFDNGLETIDLSLRLRENRLGKIKTAPKCLIVNYKPGLGWSNKNVTIFKNIWDKRIAFEDFRSLSVWSTADFRIVGYEPLIGHKTVKPIVEQISSNRRWAIKISSPSDQKRFEWGDTYFAEALQSSIEKIKGNIAAIDYRDSHDRDTAYLDDVVLTIRGLVRTRPHPGKINILWVISHPERVTEQEIREYDIVYAAGEAWAKYATRLTGVAVKTLMQCTDPSIFYPPDTTIQEYKDRNVFVGNSRNVFRPIVRDAVNQGIDLAIFGSGWEQYVDKRYIHGTYIPNHELPVVYGSAKVVLNDHWADMSKWGFFSNRLFDAAATGARVLSDDIENHDRIFHGLVVTYKKPSELKELLTKDVIFPSTEQRLKISQQIRKLHSFDARAQELVHDVELLNKLNTNKG